MPWVHEEATVPLRDEATVNLGTARPARGEAASPARIRYFGDYEIVRELARGGMGVVFQARQVTLNRPVALKMILAGQLADEDAMRRFHIEAEAAANLDHPGIVPIYEVGEHEGQHYFSMGFVEGQGLSGLLAAGPLPPRQAAELMAKVAEAIEYAHQRGVIHRDLKPANILLDRAGNPRVTDFGLAKKLEGDSGLTGSGQIMGTPSYMPPEQAGGKRGDVGPAADVYALGATLYALVTGRPPFQAATAMDTVLQVIGDEPVPPRRLNASVPLDLETICLKCLEKEQGKRYGSASDLAEDLRRYLDGVPIAARPVGRVERAWRWCNRNRAVAALMASVFLITVLGSVGVTVALIYALRAKNALVHQLGLTSVAEGKARDSERETAEQLVKTRTALLEADTAVYVNEIATAQKSLAAGDVREAGRALGRTRPGLRSWEYVYLDACAGRRADTPAVPIAGCLAVAFSPDGSRLAMAGPAPGPEAASGTQPPVVIVLDVASGREQVRIAGRFNPRMIALAFDPGGRRLATASWGTLCLWDLADGRALHTWPIESDSNSLAFSPDGTRLAAVAEDGMRTIWGAETGKVVRELEGRKPPGRKPFIAADLGKALAFSPDGSRLAASFFEGFAVKVWDAKEGRLVLELKGSLNRVDRLAFSPDGRWLATAGGNLSRRADAGELIVWDAATGTRAGSMFAVGLPRAIAFSKDSRTLAACIDADVQIWEVPGGRLLRTLTGHTLVNGLSFHPVDGRLATAGLDPPLRVWNLEVERDAVVLKPPFTNSIVRVEIDPQGRRIAAVDPFERVLAWADGLRGAPRSFPGACFAFPAAPGAIAVAGIDGHVRIFDISSGDVIRDLPGRVHPWGPLAFAEGGRKFVMGTMGRSRAVRDMTIELRDIDDGRRLGTWPGSLFALRPDGRELATMSADSRLTIVELGTIKERLAFAVPKDLSGLQYSPDGHRLATSHIDSGPEQARRCRVWDARDGRPLQDLEGRALMFHPDGSGLFTTTPDGRVRFVDAEQADIRDFAGHEGEVTRALVTPDRKRLITGGKDATIRLWDLETGQPILVLKGHTHWVNDLALEPHGDYLISASPDQTLHVWPSSSLANTRPAELRRPEPH